MTAAPSPRTVLGVLTKSRIQELARAHGLALAPAATKDGQIEELLASDALPLGELVRVLGRDELKAACRAHGLDDAGRARLALAGRLLEAAGLAGASSGPLSGPRPRVRYVPHEGDIALVRHRQYLVQRVDPPPEPGHATRVELVCLDDDAQGRPLEVLWELELGAKVLQPETHGLGAVTQLDQPRHFGAYLHALKWNAVTATRADLFQSPFRAGIKLMNHQLTPLKKALELPRANLFVADDVGLGKTIEAGLILQELILRQRVELALIIAPAAVCLQWRDEMEKRFGLRFEIYNRAFVARRRQERGFGVNPWSTHNRFIISYQTFRRPEYRDPLLQQLAELDTGGQGRARKSLLILDEAHTAAPASASRYAIDSRTTRAVRDLAGLFENRLFLSATPHNGHSNSFSALLEILDPQRFTRGVKVSGEAQLEPVMVRRLKEDLRQLGEAEFPVRKVVELDLLHEGTTWHVRQDGEPARALDDGPPVELELSRLLHQYTELSAPERSSDKLVFINLQKRLLSSVDAFYRTLSLHARSVGQGKGAGASPASSRSASQLADDDEYGADDEALEETAGHQIELASLGLPPPAAGPRELLDRMLDLAGRHRGAPDAKVLALIDWICGHQCEAVAVGGAKGKGQALKWKDRRVLIFTEYGDTERYLWQVLSAAVAGTDKAEQRIARFHGGMSDDQREEIQRAFNGPGDEFALRILIATDAAREGVNLQGHCADLFHFDVPWNPARMEQRNGRIDRTLQRSPEVRCHYFFYPQRTEDAVLRAVVKKVDVIQRELGSLGTVVMDRLADLLDSRGIDERTGAQVHQLELDPQFRAVAREELESSRAQQKLKKDIDDAGRILNRSQAVLDFAPELLRDAIDVGLELAGAKPLEALPPIKDAGGEELPAAFSIPGLPASWEATLDTLRPPRHRDEPFWEWRKREPLPVVFQPPRHLTGAVVHLHLQHPFVQRILSRFLAQGFSAHDLSRVTLVRGSKDALVRVIAFGRLSLFGPGATRLHDELVSVAAQWTEGEPLRPFAEEADRRAVQLLDQLLQKSPSMEGIPPVLLERLRAATPGDFAALWPQVEAEADAREHDARRLLTERGRKEAEDLRRIIETQRKAIDRTIDERRQKVISWTAAQRLEQEQYDQESDHMRDRLTKIDRELEREPAQLEELYRVVLKRVEPVGLLYLWPETRL